MKDDKKLKESKDLAINNAQILNLERNNEKILPFRTSFAPRVSFAFESSFYMCLYLCIYLYVTAFIYMQFFLFTLTIFL